MAISYHLYGNGGTGGAVDYGTVLATVASGTTWNSGPLAAGSDWTFAIRAFDTVSGLEEKNVDVRVRVRVGAASQDVTSLPPAPTGLTVIATANGGATVAWSYPFFGLGANAPTGFHVYSSAGTTLSYTTPAATLTSVAGVTHYSVALTGLTNGQLYTLGVRAYNAIGEEANTATATVTGDTVGPAVADALAATVIF